MRAIVTDPINDYIFVTEFDVLAEHLENLINQACVTQSTGPSTVTPTQSSTDAVKSTSTTVVATTEGLI